MPRMLSVLVPLKSTVYTHVHTQLQKLLYSTPVPGSGVFQGSDARGSSLQQDGLSRGPVCGQTSVGRCER